MENWIELPVVYVTDKTQEQIDRDAENGIEYDESEYSTDWTCFRASEIIAFNVSKDPNMTTVRLINGDMFKVNMSYMEVKKMILNKE